MSEASRLLWGDVKVGDQIECYERIEVARVAKKA